MRKRGWGEIALKRVLLRNFWYSHLTVTKDYKIILNDLDNREIKMEPLAKTVFIFYLNHLEGVLFKDLHDHKRELMNIYKSISSRENLVKMDRSIKSIMDPHSNSINEKCSRIKEAFLKEFHEEIACEYYITGKKGRPKRIKLTSTLINREDDLVSPTRNPGEEALMQVKLAIEESKNSQTHR